VTAHELTATAHLEMVAALQPLVDAYALGLKGCTVFRPNPGKQGVLRDAFGDASSNCCEPTRRAA
jgi:hypothetical protein